MIAYLPSHSVVMSGTTTILFPLLLPLNPSTTVENICIRFGLCYHLLMQGTTTNECKLVAMSKLIISVTEATVIHSVADPNCLPEGKTEEWDWKEVKETRRYCATSWRDTHSIELSVLEHYSTAILSKWKTISAGKRKDTLEYCACPRPRCSTGCQIVRRKSICPTLPVCKSWNYCKYEWAFLCMRKMKNKLGRWHIQTE